MNNKRRKKLENATEIISLIKKVQCNENEASSIITSIEQMKSSIEKVMYEEQDSFYNMPENLQGSQRGCDSEEAIVIMQESIDSLDEIIDDLQNNKQEMGIEEVVQELEDVCEELRLLEGVNFSVSSKEKSF